MGSRRRISLDVLMVMWGWGTWLGVNAFFVQLPLLIERAPERYALPSSMTIAVQLGNSGLILYALLRKLFPRVQDSLYIYILLAILTASLYLNSFLYAETAPIGGNDKSIAYLVLSFGVALVGCTSSVLFYPYLRHFRDVYLATYLVGEGLSGLLPSTLALVQGVGGEPECSYPEDDLRVEIVFPQPRFDSTVFFIIIGCLALMSLVSFAVLDNYSTFLTERISSNSEREEKLENCEAKIEWNWKFIGVLILMACLNAVMNGTLPSIQSYSCMPYGRNIYHLAVTLGAMSNPVVCMAGVWLKPVSPRVLAAMLLFILVPLSFIFATAALSPAPPLRTETIGKVLVVLSFVVVLGGISYARMWIYGFARRGGGSGMKACGTAGQVGSALGSLTLFLIVNYGKVFTEMETCPARPSNLTNLISEDTLIN